MKIRKGEYIIYTGTSSIGMNNQVQVPAAKYGKPKTIASDIIWASKDDIEDKGKLKHIINWYKSKEKGELQCINSWWSSLKFPLSNKQLVAEASEKRMRLAFNWHIGITLYVSSLSKYLLRIVRNIPAVFVIIHRWHGCECKIYAQLIVIDLCIYNRNFCGGGRWCKRIIWREDVIKVIKW